METEAQIRALPKIEQHVHIVGSTRPETLLWLAENDATETSFKSIDAVHRFFQYRNFAHFISVYTTVLEHIRDESQFDRITYELLESEAKSNVRYVEASFSAPDHVRRGLDYGRMIDAINRAISRGRMDFGIECHLRIDLVRNYGPECGMEVLDWIESKGDNVTSIDIGGNEDRFKPQPFADVYRRAKKMGLHLVAHAGEAAGVESIRDALDYLDVEHIGHGVAAASDAQLMKRLAADAVTVEACPTSNLRTGVIRSIREHPIRLFLSNGLNVTVNTDDPSMFGTDMNNEFLSLNRKLHFTVPELFTLSLNAVESSFLPAERRVELKNVFIAEYEHLTNADWRSG